MKKLILLFALSLGTYFLSKVAHSSEIGILNEVTKMSRKQCQDALYLNTLFYEQTEKMTNEQRRSYFPQFVKKVEAMGIPAPRPPLEQGSAAALQLKKCADSP